MSDHFLEILVIGSGGREHAIAWALSKDPRVKKIYVAPGNGGTALETKVENIPLTSFAELADFASKRKVHLTVVGPEDPLSNGIVDFFAEKNLPIFGPTSGAAQLESSKEFAKSFMERHNIPTATYRIFSDANLAHGFLSQSKSNPIVIKADGLAAGKGVVIARNSDEAHEAVDMLLVEKKFGSAGKKIVIEEFLKGREVSYIVAADGKSFVPLASSQDHKRLLENDRGPNTGGMGAISPAGGLFTKALQEKVINRIVSPTLSGLKKEGITFKGFLYVGLMITEAGEPYVLEFNCRLGDPEPQPILLRLKSSFLELLQHGVKQTLDQYSAKWDDRLAVGTVIASQGYPSQPSLNRKISNIPPNQKNMQIFHAGTALRNGELLTNGGRVLCVTALGESLFEARQTVHKNIEAIAFPGANYRRDIGGPLSDNEN